MAYDNTRLIKEDVLFRGSEQIAGSQYNDAVIRYLNRVYSGIAAGASEFVPEYVDDWWWLRDKGSFLIQPPISLGTIQVVEGSTAVVFSSPPTISVVGYKLRVNGHPDLFTIATHTAASANATLDLAYTGTSGSGASFSLMRNLYTLDAAVSAMIGPITLYRSPWSVNGMTPEALDLRYPLAMLAEGMPEAFSLENEQTVRLSHGGLTNITARADYRYRPVVVALTDDVTSVPLIPQQFRHILADAALTLLLIDKNDDRSTAFATATRSAMAAMIKENRRRFLKIDRNLGHIFPRMAGRQPNSLLLE